MVSHLVEGHTACAWNQRTGRFPSPPFGVDTPLERNVSFCPQRSIGATGQKPIVGYFLSGRSKPKSGLRVLKRMGDWVWGKEIAVDDPRRLVWRRGPEEPQLASPTLRESKSREVNGGPPIQIERNHGISRISVLCDLVELNLKIRAGVNVCRNKLLQLNWNKVVHAICLEGGNEVVVSAFL